MVLWRLAILVASAAAIPAQDELSIVQACSANLSSESHVCHGQGKKLIQKDVHHAIAAESLEPTEIELIQKDVHHVIASEAQSVEQTKLGTLAVDKGTSDTLTSEVGPARVITAMLSTRINLTTSTHGIAWLPASMFSTMLFAYTLTAGFTVLLIVGLYWRNGWEVITRIIIYLAALSTMKLVVKNIYLTYHWEYPLLVTASHFFCGGAAAFAFLFYRAANGGKKVHVPTLWEFWSVVFPISLGFAVSVVAGNVALYYCSAAFTEIIASSSPVMSALLLFMIGQPIRFAAWGPIFIVVLGCVLSTSGEVKYSGMGLVCCFFACLGRAIKATLQQKAMTGELKEAYDPVTLLAWMCLPSFSMMMVYSLIVENLTPYEKLLGSDRMWGLLAFVGLSCANATLLNLSNLFCTRDLGAIGVQLVGQIKGVLTILGGVALFHESVTVMQIMGYGLVVCGVGLFSRLDKPPVQSSTKDQPSAGTLLDKPPVQSSAKDQPSAEPPVNESA